MQQYPNAHRLVFSATELKLARKLVDLKRKFEGIARSWETLNSDEQNRYVAANLAPCVNETTGKPVYGFLPDQFLFSSLGLSDWGHRSYTGTRTSLVVVDPWLVLGGLRKKEWFNLSHDVFKERVPRLDAGTIENDTGIASITSWLKPLPILWAGEGKNRIQSYQDTNTDLLTNTQICEFLPAKSLRLYRSVWDDTVWLLRYVGGDGSASDSIFDERVRRNGTTPERAVLPFPDVAVPLLTHYGVKIDRGWGLPWRMRKGAEIQASRDARSVGWS